MIRHIKDGLDPEILSGSTMHCLESAYPCRDITTDTQLTYIYFKIYLSTSRRLCFNDLLLPLQEVM